MSTLNLIRTLSHGPLLSDDAVVSPSAHAELAAAYLAMPERDESTIGAWTAMAAETAQQLDLLLSHGFTFEVSATDPYESFRDMFRDVEENRRIRMLSTESTGGHPFFTHAENDTFRAIHDVFGHFASQRGFDRHGEEAAYRRHSLMYSPLARRAMATETRGQNAALIATGEFPGERLAVLPAEWLDPYALTPRTPAEWRTVHAQRAQFAAA